MSSTLENTTLRGTTNIVGNLSVPPNSISAAAIPAGANIGTDKTIHRLAMRHSQAGGSSVVDATELLHVFRGTTGTIVAIEVAVETAAAGDATVDIDLLKGDAAGAFATVLSAVVQIDSSLASRTPLDGTLATTAATDGDLLKISIDATVGTGTLPQGLIVSVVVDETPA